MGKYAILSVFTDFPCRHMKERKLKRRKEPKKTHAMKDICQAMRIKGKCKYLSYRRRCITFFAATLSFSININKNAARKMVQHEAGMSFSAFS